MEIHLRHFKLKKSSVDNNEFTELSVVVDVAVDNSGQACDPGAEDNKHCALVSSVRSARRLTADQTWRPAPSFSGRKAVVQSEGGRQLTRLLLPPCALGAQFDPSDIDRRCFGCPVELGQHLDKHPLAASLRAKISPVLYKIAISTTYNL